MDIPSYSSSLKRLWFIFPIFGLLSLGQGIALYFKDRQLTQVTTTLTSERDARTKADDLAEKHRKETEDRYQKAQKEAWAAYADSLVKREAIVVKSTNTIREYEKTNESNATCISPEWVQQLKDHQARVFPSGTQTP